MPFGGYAPRLRPLHSRRECEYLTEFGFAPAAPLGASARRGGPPRKDGQPKPNLSKTEPHGRPAGLIPRCSTPRTGLCLGKPPGLVLSNPPPAISTPHQGTSQGKIALRGVPISNTRGNIMSLYQAGRIPICEIRSLTYLKRA